jgi:Asp/Glu/hydantoin racemase
MAKYKIWWQSSTPVGAAPILKEYENAIIHHSKDVLSSDFELSVHGVSRGTFELNFIYNDSLNNREIMENFISAEKEGYDAIAIGCFLDPCLHKAREILDIPIASLGEVSMHFACMYGKKFAIVNPMPLLKEKFYEPLIREYSLEYRCAGMEHVVIPFEQQAKAFSEPDEHIREFMRVSKKLIDQGADVIISGCGILNMLLAQNKISKIENTGVPFVNGSTALMKTAETMIVLKEILGTKVSRKGYYQSPRDFRETRKVYGLE